MHSNASLVLRLKIKSKSRQQLDVASKGYIMTSKPMSVKLSLLSVIPLFGQPPENSDLRSHAFEVKGTILGLPSEALSQLFTQHFYFEVVDLCGNLWRTSITPAGWQMEVTIND